MCPAQNHKFSFSAEPGKFFYVGVGSVYQCMRTVNMRFQSLRRALRPIRTQRRGADSNAIKGGPRQRIEANIMDGPDIDSYRLSGVTS